MNKIYAKDELVGSSVNWLHRIQNPDGGWGMYDYAPSRILTTAEAVTALAIAGDSSVQLQKGIEYLITCGNDSEQCKFNRHHAWIIYALFRLTEISLQ